VKKKLETVSDFQKAEHLRLKKEHRKKYRRLYYLKNKEWENQKNNARYQARYKSDPVWREKRLLSCRNSAAKKSKEWHAKRSKKYRKPYSSLSESARSKIRKAYTAWAKINLDWRAEYARQWRRRKATYGFRSKIAEARRSGDIGKLAQECLHAIIQTYEKSGRE